jgi:hypothetical protein
MNGEKSGMRGEKSGENREFFLHGYLHIMILAQRDPAREAWLRRCSYANTFVNKFPLCGFVNWYHIMRRKAGALNVHPSQLERKIIKARQNNYKNPKLFCIN